MLNQRCYLTSTSLDEGDDLRHSRSKSTCIYASYDRSKLQLRKFLHGRHKSNEIRPTGERIRYIRQTITNHKERNGVLTAVCHERASERASKAREESDPANYRHLKNSERRKLSSGFRGWPFPLVLN